MAPLPPVAYSRAAARSSSASTRVTGCKFSGLLRACDTNSAQWLYSSQSQRSRINASSVRPSVTITCAIADSTATLVPGRNGRWCCASICGERTMSVRRGSMTISFAPGRPSCPRNRRFIRLAKTGWPSVGLAPMIRMTSLSSTLSKSCVPALVPKVVFRPYPVGE